MKSRYFVKFTIHGLEGVFWTDLYIDAVDTLKIGDVMDKCLTQATIDAKLTTGKSVSPDNIDIQSFNLIQCITEIKLTSTK